MTRFSAARRTGAPRPGPRGSAGDPPAPAGTSGGRTCSLRQRRIGSDTRRVRGQIIEPRNPRQRKIDKHPLLLVTCANFIQPPIWFQYLKKSKRAPERGSEITTIKNAHPDTEDFINCLVRNKTVSPCVTCKNKNVNSLRQGGGWCSILLCYWYIVFTFLA